MLRPTCTALVCSGVSVQSVLFSHLSQGVNKDSYLILEKLPAE